MIVGITFANLSTKLAKHETEKMLDQFSPPIMIAFFTIVGAEMVFLLHQEYANVPAMELIVFSSVYIIFRIIDKLLGTYTGGALAKSNRNIKRYLGFCLLPQAQAAMALAFYARSQIDDATHANMIVLVTIIGTIVYELLGPFGLRHSLIRCDEVGEDGACIVNKLKKGNSVEPPPVK